MKNLGNKSNTIFIFLLFIILALILIINNISSTFSFSPVYHDPVISTKNIRGTIYDRNGNALALDKTSAGLKIVDESKREETSKAIGDILSTPALLISSLINDGVTFFPFSGENMENIKEIEKKVESTYKDKVTVTTENTRVYPYRYLDEIIGVSPSSEKGLSGVEYLFNDYLKALPTVGVNSNYGEDLVLTIDKNLEETLYTLLYNAGYTGESAILNRKGEILAYYGDIKEELLLSITYSHSTKDKTELFSRGEYIALEDTVEIYPYYIYLSDNNEEILSLIANALEKEGRVNYN